MNDEGPPLPSDTASSLGIASNFQDFKRTSSGLQGGVDHGMAKREKSLQLHFAVTWTHIHNHT
jgi:hypothetical protein